MVLRKKLLYPLNLTWQQIQIPVQNCDQSGSSSWARLWIWGFGGLWIVLNTFFSKSFRRFCFTWLWMLEPLFVRSPFYKIIIHTINKEFYWYFICCKKISRNFLAIIDDWFRLKHVGLSYIFSTINLSWVFVTTTKYKLLRLKKKMASK